MKIYFDFIYKLASPATPINVVIILQWKISWRISGAESFGAALGIGELSHLFILIYKRWTQQAAIAKIE